MIRRGRVDVRGVEYEYRSTPETGVLLGRRGRWSGYRVRYRAEGERRFTHVLLVDHDHDPTRAEVAAAIEFHRFGELAEPAS